MKIGLRGGHSPNCKGAIGIIDEQYEVRKIYNELKPLLESAGHEVIDCNSNASTAAAELLEGTNKANANNCNLFISIHMNAANGLAHGTECLLYDSSNTIMSNIANNICNNFQNAGFTNRGIKYSTAMHDLNSTNMPSTIIETLFCDNSVDVELYNKLGEKGIARLIGNAIDSAIPVEDKVKVNATVQSNTGADFMRLYIIHEGEYVRVKDKKYGYYLTASGTNPGDNVEFRPESGNSDQLWKLVDKKYRDSTYSMLESALNPELVLSVEDNGIGSNNLKLWTDLHNMKQKFYVRSETDDTSLLIHAFSFKCISAAN